MSQENPSEHPEPYFPEKVQTKFEDPKEFAWDVAIEQAGKRDTVRINGVIPDIHELRKAVEAKFPDAKWISATNVHVGAPTPVAAPPSSN